MLSVKSSHKLSRIFVLPLSIGIGLSLLLAGVVHAGTSNISVNVCYPPATPIITSPSDGFQTTNNSVLLRGSADSAVVVTVYQGTNQAGYVTAGSDGSFSISVNLNLGTNTYSAKSSNACGVSPSSATVKVVRTALPNSPKPTSTTSYQSPATSTTSPPGFNTQPVPTSAVNTTSPLASTTPLILEPADNTHTANPDILIKGKAPPNMAIQVILNGHQVGEVMANNEGEFAISLVLESGKNQISVAYKTGPERISSKTTVVIYDSPAVANTTAARKSINLWLILVLTGFLLAGLLLWLFKRRRKRKGVTVTAPMEFRPQQRQGHINE